MDVEPPYGNVMPSGPQINDFEALGAGNAAMLDKFVFEID